MAPLLKHASSRLGSVIFRLPGPLTVETAPRTLESLQELYHPNLRFILLDFTDVHEIDSSALATLAL